MQTIIIVDPYSVFGLSVYRFLYVSLMALVLIVTGAVLTAFLYPRSVVVQVVLINSTQGGNNSYVNVKKNQSYGVELDVMVNLELFGYNNVIHL